MAESCGSPTPLQPLELCRRVLRPVGYAKRLPSRSFVLGAIGSTLSKTLAISVLLIIPLILHHDSTDFSELSHHECRLLHTALETAKNCVLRHWHSLSYQHMRNGSWKCLRWSHKNGSFVTCKIRWRPSFTYGHPSCAPMTTDPCWDIWRSPLAFCGLQAPRTVLRTFTSRGKSPFGTL